jgi:hypothetical protein
LVVVIQLEQGEDLADCINPFTLVFLWLSLPSFYR